MHIFSICRKIRVIFQSYNVRLLKKSYTIIKENMCASNSYKMSSQQTTLYYKNFNQMAPGCYSFKKTNEVT